MTGDASRPESPSIAPEVAQAQAPLRIETARFFMERIGPEHAGLVAAWLANPRVMRALGHAETRLNPTEAAAYMARLARGGGIMLGIWSREAGVPIGFYTLEIEAEHNVGTITLVLGDDAALRKAAAIETARALMDWVFVIRKLDKIVARVAAFNQVTADWLSTRMTLEGRLREQIALSDGSRADILVYGLLRSEWTALRRWSVENQAARHGPGAR